MAIRLMFIELRANITGHLTTPFISAKETNSSQNNYNVCRHFKMWQQTFYHAYLVVVDSYPD